MKSANISANIISNIKNINISHWIKLKAHAQLWTAPLMIFQFSYPIMISTKVRALTHINENNKLRRINCLVLIPININYLTKITSTS